jgi:putative membrane protein
MKRLITFGFFSIFLAVSLLGCADGTQNTSNSAGVNRTSTGNGATTNAGNTTNSNTVIVTNSNSSMNMNAMNSSAGANPTDPQGFMTKAAQGGMAEVELSRLAATKAQNAEVKQFAQKMIQDHTNANTEVKALATKKNITLPTELDAEHKAIKDKLQGLSGAEFDKAYMQAMVTDHEKTVDLFESQSGSGTDADAKALATKTLPTLKMHEEMAKNIQGKLK